MYVPKNYLLRHMINLGSVNRDVHSGVSTTSKVNTAMCGAQYVTLHIKIGWRKVKPCKFGPAKWLWSSIFVQFTEACESQTLAKGECNRYELAAAPCLPLPNHNHRCRLYATNGLLPLCDPTFTFERGFGKRQITKLGCEKYLCRVTY